MLGEWCGCSRAACCRCPPPPPWWPRTNPVVKMPPRMKTAPATMPTQAAARKTRRESREGRVAEMLLVSVVSVT